MKKFLLILLLFLGFSQTVKAQDWKDISLPNDVVAFSSTNFQYQVDSTGKIYCIYAFYDGTDNKLKVDQYDALAHSWNNYWTETLVQAADEIQVDFKDNIIFFTFITEQFPTPLINLYSIENGGVNLKFREYFANYNQFSQYDFKVGQLDKYYWFMQHINSTDYLLASWNSGTGDIDSYIIPQLNQQISSHIEMEQVGDTLWFAAGDTANRLVLTKTHNVGISFLTFDGSAAGIFYGGGGESIQADRTKLISNRVDHLNFFSYDDSGNRVEYNFNNGVLSPATTTGEYYPYPQSIAKTYDADNGYVLGNFDQNGDFTNLRLKVLKKTFATDIWDTVGMPGNQLFKQNNNVVTNFSLAYSPLSKRFVAAFDSANYYAKKVKVLNTLPDIGSTVANFNATLCTNTASVKLFSEFSLYDENKDLLNIVGITSSDNSVIDPSVMTYSSYQVYKRSFFDVYYSNGSAGTVTLDFFISDGYDTIVVSKTVTIADFTISATTNGTNCDAGSPNLTATLSSGSGYMDWYDAPTGGNWVGSTVFTFVTPYITSTTVYYVNGVDNGCSTPRVSATAIILPLPTVNAGIDQTKCESDNIVLTGSGSAASTFTWDFGVTDGVPFTHFPGFLTFTVTATDTNGCMNTDQVNVDVFGLPTINAGGDLTICENTSVILAGAGAVNYSWDNGVTDNVGFVPPLGTTTYTVIGTDANACSSSDQIDVTVNSLPIVDAGTDQSVCFQDNTVLTGSGASSYSWEYGVTDATIFNPSTTIIYHVTGTDGNGCLAIDSVTVVVFALPSVYAGNDTTVCDNQNVILHGIGANSYSWDNGVTDSLPFLSGIGNTTYTLTGTDINGCVNTDQVDVYVNSLPSVGAGGDITSCENDLVTLSGNGANSYSWDNGISDNGGFIPPVGTTTYTVIGTDANGCSNTDQVDVTANPLPIVIAGNDTTLCENLTLELYGSGANTYTWDNGIFDGLTFLPSVGVTTYTVTGTDLNGCTNIDQVDVIVNALPIVFAGNDTTVCENQNVILHGNGANTYTWDNGITDSIPFISGVGTITYTVTGTDLNGCSSTDQVSAIVNALPSVFAGTDITVCENDLVTNSASGAISYSWDNGITDNVPFNAVVGTTTYTAIGTDANGCSGTDTKDVIVYPAANIGAGSDQVVCENTLITLASTGAQFLAWDNGVFDNTSFFQLVGTITYTVNGTDFNGCSGSDQVDVTVNPLPSVDAGINQSICENNTVILYGAGANSYSWNSGITDSIPFTPNLGVTSFAVTGTDLNGCSANDTVFVTVNALPIVDAGIDQTACENELVTLNGSGANSYSWNNGITDGLAFTPSVGNTTFAVTGTDVNGCSANDTLVVTVNSLPVVSAGIDFAACLGSLATVTASGALTYTWDNGVFDNVPFTPNLGNTTLVATGTDLNGCSGKDTLILTVNPLPIVDAGIDQTVCENTSLTLNGSGATAYSWDNGIFDNVPFTPAVGNTTFVVIGTDINACSANDTLFVTVNALPTINVINSLEICRNEPVTLTASSSTPFIFWLDQNTGGNTITQNETYSSNAILTDTIIYVAAVENGCQSLITPVQISVNSLPQISLSSTNSDCGVNNGSATATISQGTAPFTYYWSNGEQQILSITNIETGSYYFNVEDSKGCKTIDAIEIIPSNIAIVPSLVNPSCFSSADGSITVSVSGMSGNIHYMWNTGHQSTGISNLPAGTYEVTLRNDLGCEISSSFQLTQPSLIENEIVEAQPSCGLSDGQLQVVNTSGDFAPFTHSWSNGQSGITNSNLPYGIYTLTTSDNTGCQIQKTYYLSNLNGPSIVGSVSETDCSISNGAIDVELTPQIGDVVSVISWSNGASTEDITNLSNGNYVCTATTTNNCSAIRGWNLNVKKPDLQEICVVSVDSVSTTNLVIWEKVQTTGISHYNIYRESNQIGEYQLIDTVQFTNLSVFNDVVASPETRSWRYRIAAVDFCGVEGQLSPAHKTLHLNIFDLGISGTKVAWDEYEGTAFSTYNLLRYTDEFGWETIANLPTTALNFTDTISASALGLDYMLEIALDVPCTATVWRAQDFNRSRSNRERGFFDPGHGDDEFSNNSISEYQNGLISVSIFPNPFDENVNLEIKGINYLQNGLNIQVYDVNGKLIQEKNYYEEINSINFSTLEDGVYFIKTKINDETKTIKLIKN